MKMGPEPIAIPDFFTVEWYSQQKAEQKTDAELADELYISYATFAKWKKQVGWKPGMGRKYNGRKRLPITDRILQLTSERVTQKEIAMLLGITDGTVRNHLRRVRECKSN